MDRACVGIRGRRVVLAIASLVAIALPLLMPGSASAGIILDVQSTFASGLQDVDDILFGPNGNLFAVDFLAGDIYEFTRDGSRSTFASGLSGPCVAGFDSQGNLFVPDFGSGNIYEFAPDGTRTTFLSGLPGPYLVSVDAAGDAGVAFCLVGTGGAGGGAIVEFGPAGSQTRFGTGVMTDRDDDAYGWGALFGPGYGSESGNIYEYTNGVVPEPSTVLLAAAGAAGLLLAARRRRHANL